MTPTAAPAAMRTYYSSSACLVININIGQRITDAGTGMSKMVNQKVAEFSPMADNYGRLVTNDPEVIAALDRRVGPNSDVFDGAEYTKRTTPIEVRNQMLERENKRLVEDHNRLLQKLQAEGKLPDTGQRAGSETKGAAPSK